MPSPFLSSEEYDERAHELYNEGNYDEALDTLREGLALYPNAVELHVGVGYARVAREEFAWARKSFEEALVLDPDHEDGLAGLGETLLKFGQAAGALKAFRRVLELGYQDDVELMLQVGRALFRVGMMEEAKEFLDVAVQQVPDNAEAVAMVGYTEHRMGRDDAAIATLRRALQLDPDHTEARIYLGNVLYDRGEFEASLYHLDRTGPDDHWDELGIWRLIELKKSTYRLSDDDPGLKPWDDRLNELGGDPDAIDDMLGEIEQAANKQGVPFLFQFTSLLGGGADDIGVRLAAPPLLLRCGQLSGPSPREELVHVRNDDVVNRLLRAADAAQVGDVSGIIGGFDLLPGEELPAQNEIGLNLIGRRLFERHSGNVGGPPGRGTKPRGGQYDIDAERHQSNYPPAHMSIYPQIAATAN